MDIKEIERAALRLSNTIHYTQLSTSRTFSELSGSEIFLKCENQQKTGSFKVRGAYNKIAKLVEEGNKPNSVVASSAGNHAQGVAFAAKHLGIKSTIVMPKGSPIAKILATEGYGAEVVLHGTCYDDAYEKALQICNEEKGVFIHPFDDPDVIAGQGTMAQEILRDLPNVDTVLVPAGGGGLLAGVAYYIKNINPRIEVIGVQAQGAPAIANSFKMRELIAAESVNTIADGIAVKCPGTTTFSLIQEYVDDVVTVSDAEIATTILLLLERDKQVVEPAGAAALSAATNRKVNLEGKRSVCILSGGNIDVSFIHKIVERGLIQRGRLIRLKVIMRDVPGSLALLSEVIAKNGANILMVDYDRMNADLDIDEAILHISCEVAGEKASKKLIENVEKAGYTITLESRHN